MKLGGMEERKGKREGDYEKAVMDWNMDILTLLECVGRVGGWLGGWMAGWVDGWVDGWVGGWLGGWLGGWMAGWLAGWLT